MKAFSKKLAVTVLLSFLFWESRWVWFVAFDEGARHWAENREMEFAKRAVAADRYERRCPDAVPPVSRLIYEANKARGSHADQ